jgi:uncharacterized membrane protein
MSVLVTIALIVVIARLWIRVDRLQQRVGELELQRSSFHVLEPVHEEPAAPEPVAPEPADRQMPLRVIGSEPVTETVTPELVEQVLEPEEPADVHAPPEPEGIAEPGPEERKFGFEDIFGRKLPIWAGGITLAVAGMLIVKYSIDAGLISPLVRVISGLIFGFALIGSAELALQADDRVRDPRVRQALAGAGVASLYGAILIAANVYQLVGPVTAFLGMAAVTALAMGLSLRFGAPSALLGLAGGLAAPALVGSGEPNIPLLASYLAMAVGGLSVLSKSQRWMWLGIGALTGGFGWAGLLLLSGTLDWAASVSLGLYIILLGVVLPMVAFSGKLGNAVRIAGSIAAAAQMAGLVATGGFTLLHWGLFGLISAAVLWISARDERLQRLPAVGLAIALLLLAAWPNPTAMNLAIVTVLGGALYSVPAILAHWGPRGSMVETAEIAAIGLAGLIVPLIHFYRFDASNDLALALIATGSALVPAGVAALGWGSPDRRGNSRFAILATTAALLLASAAYLALPGWSLAPILALIGLGLLALSLWSEDPRLETSAWLFAGSGVLFLTFGDTALQEFGRLFGFVEKVDLAIALLRWVGLAGVATIFALRCRSIASRRTAQAAAAILGYGALSQLPLGTALPLVPAAALVALSYLSRRQGNDSLLTALATLLAISFLWAALPLAQWALAGIESLFGNPVLVTELPNVRETALRLLAPAALIGAGWTLTGPALEREDRRLALTLALGMAAIGLHVLFKQVWSIGDSARFIRLGLAERTCWETLLVASALLAGRLGKHRIALGLTLAGLAHFAWYTMILHNPLWAEQSVGGMPIVNLLLPAYAIALAALWLLDRGELPQVLRRLVSAAPMVLIFLFAFSSLRQLFHGSILTVHGLSDWEDISRSIVAISLAVGFLLWGIVKGLRDWRIASLVIMILAVAKVFLLDASGLDGLLRIGSFIALGVSLIGIGWLYSRYLGQDQDNARFPATA